MQTRSQTQSRRKFALACAVAALLTSAALVACRASAEVQCETDGHCDRETGGRCLANVGTERQWCGYPDTGCPTGLRWSALDVGDGVSGRCVDPRVLDKVAPVVIGRAPAPDSAQVAPTAFITVTFSEPIAPESVTEASLQLVDQVGNPVAAARVVSGAEVVLTPRPALDPRLGYRVVVTPEVTDVAGNGMAEEVSWAFRTREAAWSSPVPLEQEASKRAGEVAAAAGGGVVVAAWVYDECRSSTCTVPDELWVAVRKGGIWGAPVLLATSVKDGVLYPLVGVSPEGRAVVAWDQGGISTPGQMMVATYDGSAWSSPVELRRDLARRFYPRAFVFDDGGIHFLYGDWGLLQDTATWVNRYSDGEWQASQSMGVTPRDRQAFVAAAKGSVPLMLVGNGLTSPVLGVRSYREGVWQPAEPVVNLDEAARLVAISARGEEFTVLWATTHVFARRYKDRIWEPVRQLDLATAPQPNLDFGEPLSSVVHLDGGSVVALWSTESDVLQSVLVPGREWSPAMAIDNEAGSLLEPRLVAGRRRALAAWRSNDFAFNEVSEAEGWRGPGLIEFGAGAVVDGTVVFDESTNTFVAVWSQPGASGVPDVLSSVYR